MNKWDWQFALRNYHKKRRYSELLKWWFLTHKRA